MSYTIKVTPAARRQLGSGLPSVVAVAAWEFINGPLRENPQRVGKQLRPPLEHLFSARRGSYRILYTIDVAVLIVDVVNIQHRRDAYRV